MPRTLSRGIVRDRQDAYYGAISDADRTGDARSFIEFMLVALRDALVEVKRSVGKGVVKSVVKILEELKNSILQLAIQGKLVALWLEISARQ